MHRANGVRSYLAEAEGPLTPGQRPSVLGSLKLLFGWGGVGAYNSFSDWAFEGTVNTLPD